MKKIFFCIFLVFITARAFLKLIDCYLKPLYLDVGLAPFQASEGLPESGSMDRFSAENGLLEVPDRIIDVREAL